MVGARGDGAADAEAGLEVSDGVEAEAGRRGMQERQLAIVELFDSIWHRGMDERAYRLEEADRQEAEGLRWTAYGVKEIQAAKKWAQSYHVSH